METNTQNYTMIKLVVLFAVLNSLALGLLFWKEQKAEGRRGGPPPVPEFERAINFLSKELHLSQNQVNRFYSIRNSSLAKSRRIHQLIFSQKDSIHMLILKKSPEVNPAKALAARIAENELKMDLVLIDQALEIQKLCNSSQLEKLPYYLADIHGFLKPENHPPPKK